MQIKPGVKLVGVQSELLLGLIIVHSVFAKYDIDLVITEVTGGEHMQGSLHCKGLAADIRSKHISRQATKQALLMACKGVLGENFDMILEGQGTESEHYHIEVHPK